MNKDYEAFCIADRLFYDAPGRATSSEPFAVAEREPEEGWRRVVSGHWIIHAPEGTELPRQGWKIHVSACLDNAERIIDEVWAYCVANRVTFKFLSGRHVVLARNSKYADRGGSGKLLTIYPSDEHKLERVCRELDAVLAGQAGPYILSDLRYASGPLHVRYGGFVHRYCVDEAGERVLAIEDPAGTLVPDVRGPVFSMPPWVTLPAFLEPHLAARRATTVTDIPFDITEALHFSNGGGVYAGVDRRTGERVVLKEARPHAGLSGDGSDAVARLRRERDTLRELAGIDAVPRLLDAFAVGDHEFVVMEFIEGEALRTAIVQRCPLLEGSPDEAACADYARWALDVHAQIERAVDEIHRRGVVYGDLHTFNVILRPDGRIALIDFEVADRVGAERRLVLGAPGFVAPPDRTGVESDRYALACLRLALFLPLQPLLGLDRAKAGDLAQVVAETFPVVPEEWLDEAVREITGRPAGPPPAARVLEATSTGWRRARASLGEGILTSATPERDDRLFPGDIAQFRAGGINLAHGAAGVLYALDVTGKGRYPDHEDWLIRTALGPSDEPRFGFYDGLHGVAYVLAHLGHRHEALKLLDMCLDGRWDEAAGDDLHGGLAGMGLNLAQLADTMDEPGLQDAAERATRRVADRLGGVDDVPEVSGGAHPYAGLMRGSSGRALLFVRMYERTGEPELLDHAATALRQDLRRCVRREGDGQLHVNEGWRTMPYLAAGSTGIGLVLSRYLAHRDDEELADAAAAVRGAACAPFYIQSGLFSGRAGMVLYLSDGRRPGDPVDPDLAGQVRRLRWHALDFQGHLAFPGDQLLRLSMDLATGSAGVLLALGAALHDEPVHLPFLGPPAPRPGGRSFDDAHERR